MTFLNLYLKKEIIFSDTRNILTKIKSNIRMFTIILLFQIYSGNSLLYYYSIYLAVEK